MSPRIVARLGVILCVLIVALVIGCDGQFNPTDSAQKGTLNVWITDKPFPFEFIEGAWVTITRVEVRKTDTDDLADEIDEEDGEQPAAKEAEEEGEEEEEKENPFIVVFEDLAGKEFNLLELQNGRIASLVETEIPVGSYDQMRIIVTSGRIELTDGREFTLVVPSGPQTGIKLHFSFEVTENDQTELLLDVDLSRAFLPIPGGRINDPSGIKRFTFKPSVAMRLITLSRAGRIAGTVTDPDGSPLANVAVTAYVDQTELTSTSTEADGTYVLAALRPGTYRVSFSAAGFEDAELTAIEVTAGTTTENVDITMQASSPD